MRSSSMLWSMSTKGFEIRKMRLTLKRRTLSFLSQKRSEKSTVRVSAVDASGEERLHLPAGVIKKDYTFQKVMENQTDLKDTDGFDWLESTELAIDKRKLLLNRLFVKQPITQDED